MVAAEEPNEMVMIYATKKEEQPIVEEEEEGQKMVDSNSSSCGAVFLVVYLLFIWMSNISLYNNIHHPSKLAVGADFYCFKQQIRPKWEDPVCANGGKWTISFPRGKADTCWLYTLLAMIGEQFNYGDNICGAVVNVRAKQEKLSLWTKDASNETAQVSIGKQWKEFLDYNDRVGFIFHEDAKKHDRYAKNRYSI
ncbi:hypothetical protein IFM89_005428 [Coptis chinensis]|uniref:eIF-4F 25 kDa subunit n=1 Tax=Coptis chinensis TaxID=261450 RepID=A0A835M8R9_9MAGN|nr:hypothetical protein IFM89_005428 [Coptis chinensis]